MPSLSSILRRKSKTAPAAREPSGAEPASGSIESSGTSPTPRTVSPPGSASTASSSVAAATPKSPLDKGPLVTDGVLYDNARNPVRVAYHHKGAPNFWLSPDSEHPVYLDGVRYPTAEHLFQCLKFTSHPEVAHKVRRQTTAQDARRVAHQHSAYVERGWVRDRLNVAAMDRVLLLKFTQHSDLSLRLLETGDALIVYATPTEAFWGAGIALNQLDAPAAPRSRSRSALSATERAARAQHAAQEAAAARSQTRDPAAAEASASGSTASASEASHTKESSEESLETLQNDEAASDQGSGPSDGLAPSIIASRRTSEPLLESVAPSPEREPHRGVHFHAPDPPPRQRLHTPVVQNSFRGKNEQGKALMRTRELLRVAAGLGWGSAAHTI